MPRDANINRTLCAIPNFRTETERLPPIRDLVIASGRSAQSG
jgi:catechol 2,3-dioxygenase-like lactoylglutathione lyase family enzyme